MTFRLKLQIFNSTEKHELNKGWKDFEIIYQNLVTF